MQMIVQVLIRVMEYNPYYLRAGTHETGLQRLSSNGDGSNLV